MLGKIKEAGIINRLFSYFTSEIKQKVVIAQTHAWKFQANLAKFFPDLGQKQQKADYFKKFTLVSQS